MSDRPTGSNTGSVGQLRFFQALAAVLALVLVGGAAYFFYRQRQIQPVAILVGGKAVTTVENRTEAKALLRTVRDEKAGAAYLGSGTPSFKENIELQRVADTSELDSEDTAKSKLGNAIHMTVEADVILIGNKPFVALPNKDDAQNALDTVRKHYANMPPHDPIVDTPSFVEQVQIIRERVPTTLTQSSPGAAAAMMWTPPPAKTYAVQPHETGWSIARKFHMNFTDFLRANSGRDINRLAPGDTVAVSKTFPALTVIVKKQVEQQEPIARGESTNNAGLRQITLVTTYINGVPQGPGDAVNIYTIRRAHPASVLE